MDELIHGKQLSRYITHVNAFRRLLHLTSDFSTSIKGNLIEGDGKSVIIMKL